MRKEVEEKEWYEKWQTKETISGERRKAREGEEKCYAMALL